MRWWKWPAVVLVVGALLALAAVWALREANVIRWGAAGAALDRIEAMQDRLVALEDADQFLVVHIWGEWIAADQSRDCLTYTTPHGLQDQCWHIGHDDDGKIAAEDRWIRQCLLEAVIGEPLPACWRSLPADAHADE